MAHLENDFLKISFPEQARVNAEEHAATLQRQRVIEEKKMKELEKIREQLETLLVGWLVGWPHLYATATCCQIDLTNRYKT